MRDTVQTFLTSSDVILTPPPPPSPPPPSPLLLPPPSLSSHSGCWSLKCWEKSCTVQTLRKKVSRTNVINLFTCSSCLPSSPPPSPLPLPLPFLPPSLPSLPDYVPVAPGDVVGFSWWVLSQLASLYRYSQDGVLRNDTVWHITSRLTGD